MKRAAAIVLGLGALGWPARARAINGTQPRVPPTFYDAACIVEVSADAPLFEIGLTMPYEDVELTDDELPDSRTFQLYAFGRDVPPSGSLPNWVTLDDAQRAMQAGLLDALPEPSEVLPTSDWAALAYALVEPDARLPIACDSAGPWPWETARVRPGAYVVWGYTFEPPLNLWTPRPGVVRVLDADGSGPPAVALAELGDRVEFGLEQGVRIEGCLSADVGTRVELAWARAKAPEQWHVFDTLEPGDGTFAATLRPPADTLYEALFVRAEAIDPSGRRFVRHARDALVVLAECQPEPLAPSAVRDGCGVAEETEAGARAPLPCEPEPAPTEVEEVEPPTPSQHEPEGGCRVGGDPWPRLWLLLLVSGVERRRCREHLVERP